MDLLKISRQILKINYRLNQKVGNPLNLGVTRVL